MFSSAGHMECTLQGWGSAADLPMSHCCAGFLLISTRPCVISLHNVNLYVQWSVCMSSSFYSRPAKVLGIKWISVKFPSPAFLIVLGEKEIFYPQLNKTIFCWGLFFCCLTVVGAKPHYIGEKTVHPGTSPQLSSHQEPYKPGYPSVLYQNVKYSILILFKYLVGLPLFGDFLSSKDGDSSWTVMSGVIVSKGDLSAPSEALSSLDQGFIKCRSSLIHSAFHTSLSLPALEKLPFPHTGAGSINSL